MGPRHARSHRLFRAFCVAALFSLVASAGGQELSVRDVKARIEGVYVLQEWRRGGETFRPPLVDARSVLLDGRIVFVAHDHARTATKTTLVGYGTYSLEPGKFSYSYERWLTVTRNTNGTSVSDETWAGPREFAVEVERDGIRFKLFMGRTSFGSPGMGRPIRMAWIQGSTAESLASEVSPPIAPEMETVKEDYGRLWAAFTDITLTIGTTIVTGDFLANEFTIQGTHRVALLGIEATDRPMKCSGVSLMRFEGDRCAERWSQTRMLGMVSQLGGSIAGPAEKGLGP